MTVAGATLVVFGFLALAGHTLQYRREPGAVAFLTSCLVCAGLALILASSVAGLSAPATALPVALAGWTLAAVAWAAFAFAYTGRGPTMTPRRTVGLLVAGGLGAIVMIAIEWLPVAADVAVLVIAPLSVVVLGLASFGCFLLARAGLLERDLATGQAGLVTVAGLGIVLLFLIGNLDTVLAPATIRGALLATLGVTAGALLVASLGFDLFASGPGAGYLARETVIDRMDACVILTDRDGQIIDCNRATEHTFGHERPTARGMAVSNLLGEQPAPGTHTLPTRSGHRDFDVTSSPLFTRAGEFVGYVLLLRDVTDRRTHEQRLAVLNRVLRHNLRNELDAIRAFAEAVPETGDPTTLATRIHDTAGDSPIPQRRSAGPSVSWAGMNRRLRRWTSPPSPATSPIGTPTAPSRLPSHYRSSHSKRCSQPHSKNSSRMPSPIPTRTHPR